MVHGRVPLLVTVLAVVTAIFALLSLGAIAQSAGPADAVEVERWLVSPDGRLRRVTIIVDARVADPEALAASRYPGALHMPGVIAQSTIFAKWAPGDTPVTVLYEDTFDPPGIDGVSHLLWAMNLWNSVSGQSFAFLGGGGSFAFTPACDENEGDDTKTVRFSLLLEPGVLGETCTIFDFSGIDGVERIVEFDMHLDAATDWSVAPVTPGDHYDLRSVLLHELGHAFGLDHSESGTVMQPYLDAGETVRSLTADDIEGMRTLYGVPEPPETQSPTPQPTPAPTPEPSDRPYRSTLVVISRD